MISSRKLLMNSCLSLSRRTYFQGGSNEQAAKIEDYERYISRVKSISLVSTVLALQLELDYGL